MYINIDIQRSKVLNTLDLNYFLNFFPIITHMIFGKEDISLKLWQILKLKPVIKSKFEI
jgi:hypothetical protein